MSGRLLAATLDWRRTALTLIERKLLMRVDR
jgi:hypothetical protein